jgi:colanic acid biosynthesis glycosyl transferase WcaI
VAHITILTQTYPPDPAAVGQYIADAAEALVRRGHRVTVYTSARGYEDPSLRYPSYEVANGVEIHRLSFGSFGKRTLVHRIFGVITFATQVGWRSLFGPPTDLLLFSTSPPLIGVVANVVAAIRRLPMVYWIMDLNPDQLIALGKLREGSVVARGLRALNSLIVRRSKAVVVLDRFMANRVMAATRSSQVADSIVVIPPWPLEETERVVPATATKFRKTYGLEEKFVVMYSGNHSPSNPLDTLLQAALRLRDDDRIRFVFVGGGLSKKDVEAFKQQHALTNIVSLPYQPKAELHDSLSAADVHVVTLGDSMVGIIHPCKVYGAMAVSRPILYFGPAPSHVSDILIQHGVGMHVAHGDVEGAMRAIQQLVQMGPHQRDAMGETASAAVDTIFSTAALRGQFCDVLEAVVNGVSPSLSPSETSANTPADAQETTHTSLESQQLAQ